VPIASFKVFVPDLMTYHAQRRGRTVAEVTPTRAEVVEFLKKEAAD